MMLPRASIYLNPALRSRVYVTVGCPSVHPSVWLSRRSTAAAACGWFAAERVRAADVDVCTSFRLIYCILFRKFLISKINVALQLLKLWLKKVTTTTTVDRQLRAPRTGYGSTSAAGAGAQQQMRVASCREPRDEYAILCFQSQAALRITRRLHVRLSIFPGVWLNQKWQIYRVLHGELV